MLSWCSRTLATSISTWASSAACIIHQHPPHTPWSIHLIGGQKGHSAGITGSMGKKRGPNNCKNMAKDDRTNKKKKRCAIFCKLISPTQWGNSALPFSYLNPFLLLWLHCWCDMLGVELLAPSYWRHWWFSGAQTKKLLVYVITTNILGNAYLLTCHELDDNKKSHTIRWDNSLDMDILTHQKEFWACLLVRIHLPTPPEPSNFLARVLCTIHNGLVGVSWLSSPSRLEAWLDSKWFKKKEVAKFILLSCLLNLIPNHPPCNLHGWKDGILYIKIIYPIL